MNSKEIKRIIKESEELAKKNKKSFDACMKRIMKNNKEMLGAM